MRKSRVGWLALVAWSAAMVGCGACERREAGTGGAGGSGGEEPSSVEAPVLEVTEVFTRGAGADTSRTSFITSEPITVRARVRNGKELEDSIRWSVKPVGPHSGEATPPESEGRELVFRTRSQQARTGSRRPNPPLEYELVATLPLEDGAPLSVRLPPESFIRQEEGDVLRQEYVDFGTSFQPSRAQVSVPPRPSLNTGNYRVIAEEQAGELSRLLQQLNTRVNALLNNDVQEQRPGTRGLLPGAVVVSPGAAVLDAGPLGDTDPEGDDVCAGPFVAGRCAGPIRAGPNGTADTRANNRRTRVDLEPFVASAFRNPQRNRAIGSVALNSRHTRGRALDIDPRTLRVPGKTPQQLMCIVEAAGDTVAGEKNSFTERGAAVFLACANPSGDHVHVQR